MPARRRANGEGTIVRRADGRFHAAYYVLTPEGARRRRFVYGRTWEECHTKLVEMKAKTAQGVPLAVKDWTVGRYLQYWLHDVAARHLRPSTIGGYEIVIRVHLTPAFGKKQLNRLSPQDVRRFLTRKRQDGLSVRMVQYIHAVLRNALQNAVREELISRNVAKLVQVETPDYEVGKGLTIAEAQRLLQAVRDSRWHPLYVAALLLGLRRGELLGLRWSDVDLENGSLTVRQNLIRAGGELRIQAPKTRRSRRTLPLLPQVVSALRRQRVIQAAQRLAAGSSWAGNGLGFTPPWGRRVERATCPKHLFTAPGRAR